jgi:hypothetical protein
MHVVIFSHPLVIAVADYFSPIKILANGGESIAMSTRCRRAAPGQKKPCRSVMLMRICWHDDEKKNCNAMRALTTSDENRRQLNRKLPEGR